MKNAKKVNQSKLVREYITSHPDANCADTKLAMERMHGFKMNDNTYYAAKATLKKKGALPAAAEVIDEKSLRIDDFSVIRACIKKVGGWSKFDRMVKIIEKVRDTD